MQICYPDADNNTVNHVRSNPEFVGFSGSNASTPPSTMILSYLKVKLVLRIHTGLFESEYGSRLFGKSGFDPRKKIMIEKILILFEQKI
jgi:hypothetical protein